MSLSMDNDPDSSPLDLPHNKQQDAKVIKWVMRQVAKELRDDPEFINPFYERMAVRIIAHGFALFVKWLGILALGSIGTWFLIWLGLQGVFAP